MATQGWGHRCQRWHRLGVNCPLPHLDDEEPKDQDDDAPELDPVPVGDRQKKVTTKKLDAVAEAEAIVRAVRIIKAAPSSPAAIPQPSFTPPETADTTPVFKPPTAQEPPPLIPVPPPPLRIPQPRTAVPVYVQGDPDRTGGDPGNLPSKFPNPLEGTAGSTPGMFGDTEFIQTLILAALGAVLLLFRNAGPPPVRIAAALAPVTINVFEEQFTDLFREEQEKSVTGFAGGGFIKDLSQRFIEPEPAPPDPTSDVPR